MTTVASIIDDIIRREGGYSDRESDRGGPTNWGITAKTLGHWRQLGRQATRAEVKALTQDEAREIYEADYVWPFRQVPEPLKVLVVDWGVTTSKPTVIRAMQTSLRDRGVYRGQVDGIVGPQTMDALAHAPLSLIYADVLKARIQFYQDLAFDGEVKAFLRESPRTQLHNLRGWTNRCLQFMVLE